MKSRTTPRFRKAHEKLPQSIQKQAREAYELFAKDPSHPSLRFKRIHTSRQVYSVRISRAVRALGVRENDSIVWFWIGSHDEYAKLVKRV